MYLFFDTETTGLPKNWKAPVTDLNNWPRLVQIAWILTDEIGNKIDLSSFIIKPEGFQIPTEASDIHGTTTKMAEDYGRNLKGVMNAFNHAVNRCEIVIAHNISFDEKIIGAEFLRCKLGNPSRVKDKICTMQSSTNFCSLPKNKWPKLQELYFKLFGVNFDGAHDAFADIDATVKCFFELKKRGII